MCVYIYIYIYIYTHASRRFIYISLKTISDVNSSVEEKVERTRARIVAAIKQILHEEQVSHGTLKRKGNNTD